MDHQPFQPDQDDRQHDQSYQKAATFSQRAGNGFEHQGAQQQHGRCPAAQDRGHQNNHIEDPMKGHAMGGGGSVGRGRGQVELTHPEGGRYGRTERAVLRRKGGQIRTDAVHRR